MNPEDFLNQIADAIADPENVLMGRVWICWKEGRIQIVQYDIKHRQEIIFWTGNMSHLRDGLSVVQWNLISKSIACFLQQKGVE